MEIEYDTDEAEYSFWFGIISDDIKGQIIDKFGKGNTKTVTLADIFDAIDEGA